MLYQIPRSVTSSVVSAMQLDIRVVLLNGKARWPQLLRTLTFGYNCTVHETTGFAPFYLTFGRILRLPIDITFQHVLCDEKVVSHHEFVTALKRDLSAAGEMARRHSPKEQNRRAVLCDRRVRGSSLQVGDRVLLANRGEKGKRKVSDEWDSVLYEVQSRAYRHGRSYVTSTLISRAADVLSSVMHYVNLPLLVFVPGSRSPCKNISEQTLMSRAADVLSSVMHCVNLPLLVFVPDPVKRISNRKKAEARLTGGGPPPPPLTPSEELALSLNKGRPVVDGIPGGALGQNLLPPTTTQVTWYNDDDEETTSAVTELESAGRPTENVAGDVNADEGPTTSTSNLSSLSAKELYKVHLLRQIKKSDMDMDLIQLQQEEKRLAIKKAKLEIKLLEHRLKVLFIGTGGMPLSSYCGNVVKYRTSDCDVTCPIWSDPEPTQTLKPRLQNAYCHLHPGPCSAVRPVEACLWSGLRIRVAMHLPSYWWREYTAPTSLYGAKLSETRARANAAGGISAFLTTVYVQIYSVRLFPSNYHHGHRKHASDSEEPCAESSSEVDSDDDQSDEENLVSDDLVGSLAGWAGHTVFVYLPG
ncbi:interleukin-1 receptor accessory protein-like 1-A [Pimephales promelas]|nr:interleukin-1 receptor accessory protein-like 1-A [Pimephales promelas]